MELGEKLRKARLEAGLSQRQLCGEEITRNMLSLIENGSASPSMKTLQYLAAQLGKSVSYFLEETAVVSPNQQVMAQARAAYDAGNFTAAAAALEDYQSPDEVYDREKALLQGLTFLSLAEEAITEGRELYALELLHKADAESAYCREALPRRRLLLLGRIRGQAVSSRLPSLDEELLLRAAECRDNPDRALHLLEAMEDHTAPRWLLLRGNLYLSHKDYQNAARCLHRAETAFPAETAARLELCYRELGDYKRAYEYACKQKR